MMMTLLLKFSMMRLICLNSFQSYKTLMHQRLTPNTCSSDLKKWQVTTAAINS